MFSYLKFNKPKLNYNSSSNQLNNILINNETFKGFNYDIAKTIFPFLQINSSSINTNTMFSFKNFFINYMCEVDQDHIQFIFKEDITGIILKTNGAINGLDCYTNIEIESYLPFINFSIKQTIPINSNPIYIFNSIINFSNFNFGIEFIKIKNDLKKSFLLEHNTKSIKQILTYQNDGYKYGIIKKINNLEFGMEWHLFKKFFYSALGLKINSLNGWVKTEINSMFRLAILIEQKLLNNLIFSLSFESNKLQNIEMGISLSLEF